jgi:hypothetical protein
MSAGTTAPWFVQQFNDPVGNPLSGGKLYFFVAGSTIIPKNVYSDLALTIPLSQPLTLDASGTAPQYFMESGFYKIVVTSSTGSIGSPVTTRDNIEGSNGGGSSGTTGELAVRESFPEASINWVEVPSGELWNDGMCFCWIFSAANYSVLKWLKTQFGGTAGVATGKYSIWGFASLWDLSPVKIFEDVLPDSTGNTYVSVIDLDLDVASYVAIGIAMDPGVYGPGQPIMQASLVPVPVGPSPAVRPGAYLSPHPHNTTFSAWPEPVSSSPVYRIARWMEIGLTVDETA